MKIFRFVAPVLLATSLSAPFLASAAENATCLAQGPGAGCIATPAASGQPQVNGVCNAANECQPTSASSQTGDAICLAYGPTTGCTTSAGVSGVCNASNICEPNSGSAPSVPAIPGNNAGGGTQTTVKPVTSGGGLNLNVIMPYSNSIINLINNILVPVLMAIAFIVFLWGVYKYFILGAASETERETGRQFVLWGIIGFVVILSLWGLVGFLGSALGLQPGGHAPTPPTFLVP